MATENFREEIETGKRGPTLEVLRGGKFDELPLIKRSKKILLRVQNTSDVRWLFSVFNQYGDRHGFRPAFGPKKML